jgi:hypothetical protein
LVVAHASGAHSSIASSLHWILDIAFRDDENRTWAGNAQANRVTLGHLALSLLKRGKRVKIVVQAKRRKAGWDTNYLRQILNAEALPIQSLDICSPIC